MKPVNGEQQPTDDSSTSGLVIRGSILRAATFFITAAVGFFLMPFILHSLGNRMYGLWALVGTFLNYFMLLDLGVSSAVQRYVSQALGRQDLEGAAVVVSTAVFLFLVVGIVTVLFSLLVPLLLPQLLHNSPDIQLLGKLIMIVGIGIGLSLPGRIFEGVLAARLKQDLLSLVWLGSLLTQTALIVLVLRSGGGIRSLAIIVSAMVVLRFGVTTLMGRRLSGSALLSTTRFSLLEARKLLQYGIFTLLNRIGDYLRFHLDNFVIGGFLGLAPITLYAIPVKLLEYFTNFMLSIVGFVSPLFSWYEGRADLDMIRRRFLDISRISVMAATFIGANLLLYGREFISRWIGPGYVSSYRILVILGVPATLALMLNPGISVLYGISKHHYYTVANIVEGLLNLLLSILLVKRFGLTGVALGTAAPMLLFKMCIQPVYTCRSIGMPARNYYQLIATVMFRTLLPVVPYFLLIRSLLHPTYTSMIPIWCGEILLFAPVAWWMILRREDRMAIRRAIKRW